MRMWMVPPSWMCSKHLLGEHGELHKFLHNWVKRHSIAGRIAGNLMEPLAYQDRHDALASEMASRGFNHQSPLDQPDFSYLPQNHLHYQVDVKSSLLDLVHRCPGCRERMKMFDDDEDVYGNMGLAEALSQVSEFSTDEEEIIMATKKTTPAAKKAPAEKPAVKKTTPAKAPKAEVEMVTLAMLAEESGKAPMTLRIALRTAEVQKPEGGRWAWKAGSKELAAVRKALGI